MGFSDRAHRRPFADEHGAARCRARRSRARHARRLQPVDTCGAEFAAFTPYLYSTYDDEDESALLGAKGKRRS